MNRPLDRDRPASSQVWLDVVSAVGYLSQGHRPGLTVYDALEEALRWHVAWPGEFHDEDWTPSEATKLPWDDPDPLRTAVEQLVADSQPGDDHDATISSSIHRALALWVRHVSAIYNNDHQWASPQGQRGREQMETTNNCAMKAVPDVTCG
jgi:hypothetical protein